MRHSQALLAALAAVACLAAAGAVAVGAHPAAALAPPTAGPGTAAVAAPGPHDGGDRPGPTVESAPGATTPDGDGGADGDDAEATPGTGVPTEDIIPTPNSGRPPTEAGDRGGILQIAVLLAMVVAVGGIVAKVAHDARRARDRRSSRVER